MLFGKQRKPALTRAAEELSGLVISQDVAGREASAATIRAIVYGVRTMGQLPEPIVAALWNLLVTIARKALMPGADSGKLFAELRAGIHPWLLEMIEQESKHVGQ